MNYRKLTILLFTLLLSLYTWGQDFYVIDMRTGLSESRVRQIQQMPDGRIAIATAANIDVYDGTHFVSYKLLPEYAYPLPNFSANRQLTCDKAGRIWLRHDKQLYVVDTNKGTVIKNVDSLLNVLRLDEGQIMAWPRKGAPETWKGIKDVTCMEHDCYGGLWIGTKESGIMYENPRRANQFKTENKAFAFNRTPNFVTPRVSRLANKFASQATNCSLDIPGGYAFLGTRKGLMIFDEKDAYIGTIDEHYGLASNNIQSIILDKKKRLWMTTANTIVRVKEIKKDSFDITHYGELDGIHVDGREFRTCQIHQDTLGNITVGFVGGIVSFIPDSITAPRYSFHFPQQDKAEADDTSYHGIIYIIMVIGGILIAFIGGFYFYSIRKKQEKDKQFTPDFNDLLQVEEQTIDRLKEQPQELTPDQQFLLRVKECVESNISNGDFSVQMLGNLMAMDRTGLYRRMLAITGMSPSCYIKQVRMDVAARLLRDSNANIAEIASKTGFSTTKYFNQVFKATYQLSPLEYRENNNYQKKEVKA